MKLLTSFLLCFFAITVHAYDRNSLLKELDTKINDRHYYMDIKESRIDSLRNLQAAATSPEQLYFINNEIYKEYNTYRCDSAMHYVFLNLESAGKMNNRKYKDLATINLSMLLSTTGMYMESIDNLQKIDRQHLDSTLLREYYTISEWTYYTAGEYSNDNLYTPRYSKLEDLYRDSVFSVLTPGTIDYEYYKGKRLMYAGQYESALHIFTDLYQKLEIDTRLYAIITYTIATIYQRFGNNELYEKFLIMAAISDQVCPLKENLAMQELSLYLFQNKPDDLERAYKYIQCSMEDARFYNNRLRIVQISEKMPVIVQSYQEKSEKEKSKISFALVVITILSLVTGCLLAYVYKQMNILKKNRKKVTGLNNELKELNRKLNDSNQIKEEYVGLFINLCSSYIDKLDKYRESVKRKLVTNQLDELFKMVNSTRIIESELDDFLESFDSAFLKLFPSFIDDINNLFRPEEKIIPRSNKGLNRELRILALIRLGIDDSSRIALFLRYSPQTIYNNRTTLKRKAKNKDSFEKDVMNIGNYRIVDGNSDSAEVL